MSIAKIISVFLFVICASGLTGQPGNMLDFPQFRHYIDSFNIHDEEIYQQLISNDVSADFLSISIPLIELPDKNLEKIYYFRWWTYRKHIKKTDDGYVITEFLPPVSWAGKYNTINCPAAHHIYEGRWLRDPTLMQDYLHFWLTASEDGLRSYSFWIADATWALQQVHPDRDFILSHFDLLVDNYWQWDSLRRDRGKQLFWQVDDRDGMEISVSGQILNHGKSIGGMPATRPTINSYMYGDAKALSKMASLLNEEEPQKTFTREAQLIQENVLKRLWHDSLRFFTVLPKEFHEDSSPISVRELIGYTPWYFNLPPDEIKYSNAWLQVLDKQGFAAPFGLTVCEQRHPFFRISYEGHECQWNGPSWPFATTITLKALANFLTNYKADTINRSDYYFLLKQYAQSHSLTRTDGTTVPWIDENLNPYTGDWISRTRLKNWNNQGWSDGKGGKERGKDYNHSGYCDLIIADLIGFKPHHDHGFTLQPLVPEDWEWFCLDHLRYHQRDLTIVWDKSGKKYNRGKGLFVFEDGEIIYSAPHLPKKEYITLSE